jgi:choline dehydrogenase-like flavoprotein
MERHERQTARKVDICRQAGGSNVEIVVNYPGGTGSHPLGTLRMGDTQASSVCDLHQECWTVPGLYVCDASALPNGIGGSNPARTINAFASRAAYYAMQKFFPAKWASRTWPW